MRSSASCWREGENFPAQKSVALNIKQTGNRLIEACRYDEVEANVFLIDWLKQSILVHRHKKAKPWKVVFFKNFIALNFYVVAKFAAPKCKNLQRIVPEITDCGRESVTETLAPN